jgi:hypothetical protein
MDKNSSAAATRQWAVRWVLLSLLAVSLLMLGIPHSSDGTSASKALTVYSTSAYTSTAAGQSSAADPGTTDQGITHQVTAGSGTKTATETASLLAAGVGMHDHGSDNCSCCPAPATIAVRCEAVNTGQPQQHGALPQALGEDAFVTPARAWSGRATPRAAPPSLAELSLLRI